MYEENLEKNIQYIKNIKMYRPFDTEISQSVEILNTKKILTLSGLRHTGKTQLIHLLLKKTGSFDTSFYFNGELDIFKNIKSREELTILFDLFVRISEIPKMVILQNIHHIEGIKSFISDLYKTKKYKILLVGNALSVSGVENIEVFPLSIEKKYLEQAQFGGIPQVRIIPDTNYKSYMLETIKSDILLHELCSAYAIKNVNSLTALLSYLAESTSYQSLREIHRKLKDHGVDISLLTMIDYINAGISSKVLSRSYLYDLKNKNTISSQARYYFGDVGLKYSFSNTSDTLENLIYLELKILGYDITGGLNGRFQFAFRAVTGDTIVSIAIDQSGDKNEVRKTARKLEKIGDSSSKYVIVANKNSLNMRKFQEESVKIIDLGELLDVLRK